MPETTLIRSEIEKRKYKRMKKNDELKNVYSMQMQFAKDRSL
jgi:hypothetical protein